MSTLDQLLSSVAEGKISRRAFSQRAIALGLSASAAALIVSALDARGEAQAAGVNTLTLNVVQVFGNIDPAIGIDYTQNMAAINFYDTLLAATASGDLAPRLASSYTASSDARTFVFKLRKGVKFHSGHELTAEDVVYSMQRVLTINQGPAFVWAGFLDASGVSAPDRYTVRFHLKKPFAPFTATMPLLFIIDKAAATARQKPGHYGKYGDYATAYLGSHEAGSGAYTLESDVEGSELRMKKFSGYFRAWGANSIDEVRVMIVTEEATVVSLAKTGVLDMTSNYQSNTTYSTLKNLGFNIFSAPTDSVFYLKMNTRQAPTDDIHVRKAIALAFDYKTVRDQIRPGAPVGGPLSSVFKGAYDTTLSLPSQDMAAAKAELAKSKYAGHSSIPITFSYVSNAGFEEQVALLFNSVMSQLGFKVSLNPQPFNRITDLATKVNQTPNVTEIFYSVIYPSPDSMFFVQYDSASNGTWASMEWLHDATIDALIAKSRATINLAQRNAIYRKIQDRIVALQPDVFILSDLWRQAVRSTVKGAEYIPAGQYQFYDLKKLSS